MGIDRPALLVLGIDPGLARPSALAGSAVLSLDEATGAIGIVTPAAPVHKEALSSFLASDPVLADPRLRMVCLAAPLTPQPLERKPWKARAVEIRLSRGAFSTSERGPSMPWVASPKGWPLYRQAVPHLQALTAHGFPLLTLPDSGSIVGLPQRCTVEVFPKATLAVLTPRGTLRDRPRAHEFFGKLDDWLFPQVFVESALSPAPVEAILQTLAPGLHLSPEALQETRRIAALRRPFPRREPLRAFVAALQGIFALWGCACLIGAGGDAEGSLVLPALWHPDWEADWNDGRRSVPRILRLAIASAGSAGDDAAGET